MTYITFGQDHVHEITAIMHSDSDKHEVKKITFDKDCVCAIPSETRMEGRDKAFELFGPKWCFEYFNEEFKEDSLKWFPRGIINVLTFERIELP